MLDTELVPVLSLMLQVILLIAGAGGTLLIRHQAHQYDERKRRDNAEAHHQASLERLAGEAEIKAEIMRQVEILTERNELRSRVKALEDARSTAAISHKLEALHGAAEAAYHEANDVNVKIARAIEALQPSRPPPEAE